MPSTNYELRLKEINTEESNVDGSSSWSSQDYAYKQIVSKRISLGDFNGAIYTALKMDSWANQDRAFFNIVYKSGDSNIAESAADKMNTWANQDQAYLFAIRKRISSGDIKKSIQMASKINGWANQDHAFFEILSKCDDVEDMESIASKTNTWANQDRIYQYIIEKRLSNNDINGAVRTATKINTWANQDSVLFDIFGQVKDLKTAESVAEKMKLNSNIEKAYHILIDKHRSNGNENEAARIEVRILKLEEDKKAAVVLIAALAATINKIAVATLGCVAIISMTMVLSAFNTAVLSRVK